MICSVVEHLDVSKDTAIYEEGDMGTEMYFLMDGEVEVESQGVRLGLVRNVAVHHRTATIPDLRRDPVASF